MQHLWCRKGHFSNESSIFCIFLWWRFSVSSDRTVNSHHKRNEWCRKYKLQHRKQTETQDFYVKTQCEKNHGEEERKSTIIYGDYKVYRDSQCQAKCWASWIASSLFSFCVSSPLLLEGRGYICSIHPTCMKADDTDELLHLDDLHMLVCCNSRHDGRLIVGIACSKICLGP